MSKQEDYASDSDQSDEDFCPDKINNSDAPSEEESDDPISENEDAHVSNKKLKTKKKSNNRKHTKITESPRAEPEEEHGVSTRNRVETATKSSLVKDAIESEDEDTNRKDALWADFLSDVPTTTPRKINKAASTSRIETNFIEKDKPRSIREKKPLDPPKEPEKVKVTEIFEFAGEEVRVEKVVTVDSLKENGTQNAIVPETARGSVKRSGGGGALGSILGQIGKKKKISVLEKTKLDWDSFKTTEGIDEELQTFNKGKDGYLQKQDFLERTDLRQFEIEKNMRQSRRKPL